MRPMKIKVELCYKEITRKEEFESEEVIIGRRRPDNEVDLDLTPDSFVSRRHARIYLEYNMSNSKYQVMVEDTGSAGGTFVNEEEITEPTILKGADELVVGNTTIKVRLDRTKDAAPADEPRAREVVTQVADEPEPAAQGKEEEPQIKLDRRPEKPRATSDEKRMPNESVGFSAFSVEDLASAVNRYGARNDMEPISVSMVQEGKGAGATFFALAVFKSPRPSAQ